MDDIPTVTLPDGRPVRLGKLPADLPKLRKRLWLHDYLAPARPPPEAVDYTGPARASIAQMLGNDTWGDCVIASMLHSIGVWTGVGSGAAQTATTGEAVIQYHSICGQGDPGCNIQSVLDYFKTHGLVAGGKLYRIADYVAFDHTIPDLWRYAILLSGAVPIGVTLPGSWEAARVWDMTNSRIVGGHGIPALAYNPTGPVIATWGETRQMTWAAATSGRYVDETYMTIPPEDWTTDANLARLGLDIATLRADLASIGAGQTPTIEPTPPPWSYGDMV